MQAQTHLISRQDSSTAYQLTSVHFGRAGSGRKVYIQAALHADEVPGMLVAQFLRSELLALPDRLTPRVTPETDTGKVHAMIEAEVIRVCETLRDKLARHAGQPATTTA